MEIVVGPTSFMPHPQSPVTPACRARPTGPGSSLRPPPSAPHLEAAGIEANLDAILRLPEPLSLRLLASLVLLRRWRESLAALLPSLLPDSARVLFPLRKSLAPPRRRRTHVLMPRTRKSRPKVRLQLYPRPVAAAVALALSFSPAQGPADRGGGGGVRDLVVLHTHTSAHPAQLRVPCPLHGYAPTAAPEEAGKQRV